MLLLYTAMIEDETDQLRFEDIYYRYRKQMLLVAGRVLQSPEDAEDAVQTALLGIARQIKSVPTGNDKVLRAYVLTAAKNAALNLLPQQQARENTLDISDVSAASGEDLFRQVQACQDYDLLLRCMRQMQPPYREVLMLTFVQELSVNEIAGLLHRKPGSVRQQLNRGKKALVALCRKEGMCFAEQTDAV